MIILSHTLQEFKVLGWHPEVTYQERIMEQFTCQVCGKEHSVLYVISRHVSKQFGHFLAFKIAGEWQVVDPTLPHEVKILPGDAIRVPDRIASFSWHGSDHYFYLRNEEGSVMDWRELMKVIKDKEAE